MLNVSDVHKSFGAVRALDGVSITVRPGEVRAILGGNGSGKSTLAKVTTGVVAADRASFDMDGHEVRIGRPMDALRLGIAATYQELSLLEHLSVAENLMINRLPTRGGLWASSSQAERRSEKILDRLGIVDAAPLKVRELSLADRYLVELAKALVSEPKYLILDELTSALRREQVGLVRSIIREVSEGGVGILYVSHRLEEVFDFCESVTVLRNGKVVEEGPITGFETEDLVVAMSGPKIREPLTGDGRARQDVRELAADQRALEPLLVLDHLPLRGIGGEVSLEGYPGEIVGIAGLQGHGQSELLRTLYGAIPGGNARLRLEDRQVTVRTVRDAIQEGFGFISGDRENEMIFGQRLVDENLHVVARAFKRRFNSEGLLERLELSRDRLGSTMNTLSGGNQQKVVVGRWLGVEPRVLMADDPTRGVDVRTRQEMHSLLRESADRGSLVLFSSSDERELADLCDRVYVLYRGRVVSELSGEQLNEHDIGAASTDPSRRSRNGAR